MYLLPKRVFFLSRKSSLSWHHHQFKLYGLTPRSTIHDYHWYCWYSAHFLCYDTLLPRYWTIRSKQNFTSKLVTRQDSHLTLKKSKWVVLSCKAVTPQVSCLLFFVLEGLVHVVLACAQARKGLKLVAFLFLSSKVECQVVGVTQLVSCQASYAQPTGAPPGAALCNKQGKCTSPQISGTQVQLQNSKTLT